MPRSSVKLSWASNHFRAGERVAVAVSSGADSVALLLAMAASRADTGIVLSVVHVHHGMRGAEADDDAAFVAELAARLELPLRVERGDAPALAAERGSGLEEAARALRYRIFQTLLDTGEVDTVVTAHTLDDQAETVLMKMLRGAWTEGLSGIAPVLPMGKGRIVRPLLDATREDVLAYLQAASQHWREDSTNQSMDFTRNRIRHLLLPQLREFQPRIAVQLSRMATVARDEEAWWQRELSRILPGLILPGKPVRGGGRANSTQPGDASVAIELERLRALHPALRRRVLRAIAEQLGSVLGFDQIEALLVLSGHTDRSGKAGRFELGNGLLAERTARELRLSQVSTTKQVSRSLAREVSVPGTVEAVEEGLRITVTGTLPAGASLLLRGPLPGDRIRLAHSRGEKTVKEVLERQGVRAEARQRWLVLALGSDILWMRDLPTQGMAGLQIAVEPLELPSTKSEAVAVPPIAQDAT